MGFHFGKSLKASVVDKISATTLLEGFRGLVG
jgi:hypothetical protein